MLKTSIILGFCMSGCAYGFSEPQQETGYYVEIEGNSPAQDSYPADNCSEQKLKIGGKIFNFLTCAEPSVKSWENIPDPSPLK